MKYEFLADLDDYFCEKYENYDKICVLKGYVMPKMQDSKRLPDGRDYAYTLPANTMRLALQKDKESLLAQVKESIFDGSFSFAARPLSVWERWRNARNKRSFKKVFPIVLQRKNLTTEEVGEKLPVPKTTYARLLSGKYEPTRNLIYSIALGFSLSYEDGKELMDICGFEFDFSEPKDVVISYLLTRNVTNRGMIDAALKEYKIQNLFLPEEI